MSKRGGEGEEQTKKKKTEGRTENSKQLPNHVSDEIIDQILSRLPVKSLLRFRCVCKSWCSLISDSNFVNTHLSCMSRSEEDDYKHYQIISNSPREGFLLESWSLFSVLYEKSFKPDLALHLKNTHHAFSFVGSCNGLLCIEFQDEVFIWNPSIRKSKRLPDSGMSVGTYGFGYDESILDYKVVGVFWRTDFLVPQVMVYTLKTDTWRRIQDFPCKQPPLGSGKFANKALHWPVWGSNYCWVIVSLDLAKEIYEEVVQPNYEDGAESEDGQILSLDLAKETYKEVAQPKYEDGEDGEESEDGDFNLKLGILKGCLCVQCNFHGTRACADLWILKEYGVRDSWTKLVSIPYPYFYLTNSGEFEYSLPLCISKNGEILLVLDSLIIYDLKKSTLRFPSYSGSIFQLQTYVESLVSPSAGNELQEYY